MAWQLSVWNSIHKIWDAIVIFLFGIKQGSLDDVLILFSVQDSLFVGIVVIPSNSITPGPDAGLVIG